MLKIHGVPISVHTRKVIVAALHKGLPYELIMVAPVIPDSSPLNWRDLSPTGKIPVLSDGDFHLPDSAAICAYFERLQPAQPLYPSTPRAYATALWLEQYAGTLFTEVVRPLFHEVFVHPRVQQRPTDPAQVDAVLTKVMPGVLGHLEAVASDSGFLAGPAATVADIAVVSNLLTYQYIGFALDRTHYPRLCGLYDRVVRLPAMQEALRREQPVVESMGLSTGAIATALA
jgi:glutathione S-transferase